MFGKIKLLPAIGFVLFCLVSSMTSGQASTTITVSVQDIQGWTPYVCLRSGAAHWGVSWSCSPLDGNRTYYLENEEDEIAIRDRSGQPGSVGESMINEKAGNVDKTFVCSGTAENHNCVRQ